MFVVQLYVMRELAPNAAEVLPKIWTAWVGHTNVTDDRWQTERQQTDGREIAYSEKDNINILSTKHKSYPKTGKK